MAQERSQSAGGPRRSGGTIVAIASLKGGVGKSNLALNMAVLFADAGYSTCLVDSGSSGVASAPLLAAGARFGTPHAGWMQGRLTWRPDAALGMLSAAHEAPDALAIASLLRTLRRHMAWVFVDAGTLPAITASARLADWLLLVTTPEPNAMAATYATLNAGGGVALRSQLALIVNMAGDAAEAVRVERSFARATRRFLGRDFAWMMNLPEDRHVARAVRGRNPVALQYPDCSITRCLEEGCGKLCPGEPRFAPRPSLWSRLASVFL